ncbi:MAG: thiamine pyrophosphate-dependent enzyme [Bdellovibrionota bacterium]
MYNRAEIVDQNFSARVSSGELPSARTHATLTESALTPALLIDLFESQVVSRHLDLRARILKNSNQCFYTIGSSGHEGNAVLGQVFRLDDMAFLHYRSGALMIQRSKQLPGSTPIYDTMLSFVASSEDPIAGGRHKVWGSFPLLVPPQTSTIASHLPKAMGAALSIARAADLGIQDSLMKRDSVVLCNFGDASANHSTALGAINAASWTAYQNVKMPIAFVCEDNGIGISVSTPPNWIQNNFSNRPALLYIKADGLNLIDTYLKTKQVEDYVRTHRKPAFLHLQTVRLLGHAGSDMEFAYSTLEKIEALEFNDPLLHSARILIENNILSSEEILNMYERVRARVKYIGDYTITRPKLLKAEEISASLTASQQTKTAPPVVNPDLREKTFGREYAKFKTPQHMAKLINYGLTDILLRYPNALVFGEDVAQKGGVYNVTDGLFNKFGSKRVFNSLLDEQSILGVALGTAQNGFLPIPEIQFLAYVHNAEDQIRGEAATLPFFSQGQFTNPMVLRVAGLPYQKGFGGHFHNDNSLAVFRDIPGVIIAVPSNGADAVKMMRACVREAFEKGRVVVFVEPIALYMTKDLHELDDKGWSFAYPEDTSEEIAIGQFGVTSGVSGEKTSDVTLLTYGNGFYFAKQASKILKDNYNINCKLIDLRWIAPLDKVALVKELKNDKKVLIIDECRKTGSLSEALVTMMVEHMTMLKLPLPQIKVIAAHDCFITLGVAAAAGLPSKNEIIDTCLEMLGKQPL